MRANPLGALQTALEDTGLTPADPGFSAAARASGALYLDIEDSLKTRGIELTTEEKQEMSNANEKAWMYSQVETGYVTVSPALPAACAACRACRTVC